MKIKYSSFVGLLAVLLLVASFVVPGKLASPASVDADPGLMEWTIVDTPDNYPSSTHQIETEYTGDLFEDGSEVLKLLIGNDGNTMWVIVAKGNNMMDGPPNPDARRILYESSNGGRSWSSGAYNDLMARAAPSGFSANPTCEIWDFAMAPDDPTVVAVATSDIAMTNTAHQLQQEVWITTDGGTTWQNTQWPPATGGVVNTGVAGTDWISAMDISKEYGQRKLLVGTRDGTCDGTNNIQVLTIPSYGGWRVQNNANGSTNQFTGDVIDAKFSPTFDGDSTIAVVYTSNVSGRKGTWLATGVHDLVANTTAWQAWGSHVELKNSSNPTGDSAQRTEIITADLEMPEDFSGQSASLRRFYVAIDADTDAAVRGAGVTNLPNRGVYRVDDNLVYTLMDNSATWHDGDTFQSGRRAHSIAYYGTYASGKLLVGETLGITCEAAVPVWFTDSPTVCPVPCWYPSKKPPSGAAGEDSGTCDPDFRSWGNAWVEWSPTYGAQGVAYAVTGASSLGPFATPTWGTWDDVAWPGGYWNVDPLDESAFSLTRNNGETWNQLLLIDTRMTKLTDVAPSADCSTVYLASVNNAEWCEGFDSIWRSSSNEAVVAPPLPALPIGQLWERVRVHVTALTCNETTDPQADYIILRLAPDKLDGQIVFWAAGGVGDDDEATNIGGLAVGPNTKMVEWSPDFGDFWAQIIPRVTVQDMDAESSTILYVMNTGGDVQKLPYTGTAWSNAIPTVGAGWGSHTIRAKAERKVLVGDTTRLTQPVWISLNGGASFIPVSAFISGRGNIHAIFDTDYDDNKTIYVADDGDAGSVYRNTAPSGAPYDNMHPEHEGVGYYGMAQTNSMTAEGQGTLYAAHDNSTVCYSGVDRTLKPLSGIPKPGIFWDCMDAADLFRSKCPHFTLEPRSLKICGCLTQDTDATLYAIDNDWYSSYTNWLMGNEGGGPLFDSITEVREQGMLWAYTDCMAKKGPTLTMDDGTIIGCDPATGRAQEVNFTWEQLCIATHYELTIMKDKGGTLRLYRISDYKPPRTTSPTLVYGTGGVVGWTQDPDDRNYYPGGGPALECGHTYYWDVSVTNETTDDWVGSPGSEKRSFTIKAGFKVTTPYYGPQLLAPDNGCGCPCDAPLCFSWSPFKETTAYKFELSENFDMSSPLVSTTVKGATAYQFDGNVKCNTNYFWRVMAIEPAPSEWSAVFSFMTQAEPPPPPEPTPVPEEVTPLWVWVIIAIGAVLVIVTLVLIFKTRRV